MHLPGLIYRGTPIDDVEIVERLPAEYAQLLAQRNGFVAFRGGLHIRGAATAPAWHSVRHALDGPDAIGRLFPALAHDVPFGQDAWGNQFVIRDGSVHRFDAVTGGVVPVAAGVAEFLTAAIETPFEVLDLGPLHRYLERGGRLAPGELLYGDPPAPHPAADVLRALAAALATGG